MKTPHLLAGNFREEVTINKYINLFLSKFMSNEQNQNKTLPPILSEAERSILSFWQDGGNFDNP